eukprot:763303-Hanusia_phi.AAC.9
MEDSATTDSRSSSQRTSQLRAAAALMGGLVLIISSVGWIYGREKSVHDASSLVQTGKIGAARSFLK